MFFVRSCSVYPVHILDYITVYPVCQPLPENFFEMFPGRLSLVHAMLIYLAVQVDKDLLIVPIPGACVRVFWIVSITRPYFH